MERFENEVQKSETMAWIHMHLMRGYGPESARALHSISRKNKKRAATRRDGEKPALGVGGSEFLMRGNRFAVARVGGSEILRPRIQFGGERGWGSEVPKQVTKTFFSCSGCIASALRTRPGGKARPGAAPFFRLVFAIFQ